MTAMLVHCPKHGIVPKPCTQCRNRQRWAKGSTRQWRTQRAHVLHRDPTCTEPGCNKPSTEVHHIEPGTERVVAVSKLRGVCHEHNPRGGVAT